MAKLSDTVITQDDLSKFVATQDDFGLELFVYSKARELGFSATHGGSYVDRVSGKTRQYDVRASFIINNGLMLFFAIECKCLRPSFPLLISRIPRLASESFHQKLKPNGVYNEGGNNINYTSLSVENVQGITSIYPPNLYVGKSTTQVGYSKEKEFIVNDVEVFEKWGQALSSANDLVKKASPQTSSNSFPVKAIVIPILVVSDDNLWVADYSENGTLQGEPYQVDAVENYVAEVYEVGPYKIPYTISHMHVFTKKG